MIGLYIFDVGGVICLQDEAEPSLADRLGLPPAELWRQARDLMDGLTTGELTEAEFWAEFSRRTGLSVREDLWTATFHPRLATGTVELVRELKGAARVVAGTNTIEPHYRKHILRGDYDIFDAVYASCRLGLAKPDPAFFRHILDAEGRAAAEAVFVDDLEENVAAAQRLGLRAVLYRGTDDLRRRLDAWRR